MRFVKTSLIGMLIIASTFVLLAVMASRGYFNSAITHFIEFCLNNDAQKATVSNLQVNRGKITIDLIAVNVGSGTTQKIHNVEIDAHLPELLLSFSLPLDFAAEKIELISREQSIVSSAIRGRYMWHMFPTSGTLETDIDQIRFAHIPSEEPGSGHCSYHNSMLSDHVAKCDIALGVEAFMRFEGHVGYSFGKFNKIVANAEIKDIPLDLHQAFYLFIPQSDVLDFLHNYMEGGVIKSGTLRLALDHENLATGKFSEDDVSGQFVISGLNYKYAQDFPALTSMELGVDLKGARTEFNIIQAYTSNTLISNGKVALDWIGAENSKVVASATAEGAVTDLIDFIPASNLQALKQKGMDLKSFAGKAKSNIELTVPISGKLRNTYNITTEISGAKISIFKDAVNLTNGKLQGVFNGDQVLVSGVGKVNDFDSKLSYQYNFTPIDGVDNQFDATITLQGKAQKLGVAKLVAGNALLEFGYKRKDGAHLIAASSNLKNLDFHIEKLGIRKEVKEKADLKLEGEIGGENTPINFALTGSNELKITGSVTSKNDIYTIKLPTIQHKNTQAKGEFRVGAGLLQINMRGSKLDLSSADMMQFLVKETGDELDTDINIKLDQVVMRNDIALNDFDLYLKCNKEKCQAGYLKSKIGSKELNMTVATDDKTERFKIKTTNAGAVLRGLGMYSNMKAGAMDLSIETGYKQAAQGEIIPIVEGDFALKKFVVVDTPFLTRMVSFISLPGFLSLITNNDDIVFTSMNGKFTYSKNTIRIIESSAEGPFFDFTMKGSIDTTQRKIHLKGRVAPSLYGISAAIKKVPILGSLLSGGHRKGIVTAPYTLEEKY